MKTVSSATYLAHKVLQIWPRYQVWRSQLPPLNLQRVPRVVGLPVNPLVVFLAHGDWLAREFGTEITDFTEATPIPQRIESSIRRHFEGPLAFWIIKATLTDDFVVAHQWNRSLPLLDPHRPTAAQDVAAATLFASMLKLGLRLR